MTDLDELLRRDGERWRETTSVTPHIDWSALHRPQRTHQASWSMVAVAAVTAAVVVVLAIVVPSSLHRRSSTPAPAHKPSPQALGGPSSFIAINHDGRVEQADARTGETRGMAVDEEGRRATALAVTDSGNLAYATFSRPRCTVNVLRYRWTSLTGAEATDAATVAGIKADAEAISPDGHLLALAVQPCNRRPDAVDDLVVVNLDDPHLQRRWIGYDDVSFLSGLQWGPDNHTLAYVVTPCCGGGSEGPRLLSTGAAGASYVKPMQLSIPEMVGRGVVFWYAGQLAVVMGTEIRAMSPIGAIGKVLARGLPDDVVTVQPDSTGLHLLLTVQSGKLVRWDDGVLTTLRGTWSDAGW